MWSGAQDWGWGELCLALWWGAWERSRIGPWEFFVDGLFSTWACECARMKLIGGLCGLKAVGQRSLIDVLVAEHKLWTRSPVYRGEATEQKHR
ncbi:hypothetical protein M8818_007718 [Zalaria obscura]|uniref:Uncharacterized protein n=1 Tax=Zalaria obscura TaxID=2024903 RepID=A0ACC3S636_9PEZI